MAAAEIAVISLLLKLEFSLLIIFVNYILNYLLELHVRYMHHTCAIHAPYMCRVINELFW